MPCDATQAPALEGIPRKKLHLEAAGSTPAALIVPNAGAVRGALTILTDHRANAVSSTLFSSTRSRTPLGALSSPPLNWSPKPWESGSSAAHGSKRRTVWSQGGTHNAALNVEALGARLGDVTQAASKTTTPTCQRPTKSRVPS